MSQEEPTFERIHETFRPRVFRYLSRLVGENEAEDLTQEVFVKISRALPAFRGDSQLSTWIYRIATNAALDRIGSPAFRREIQARLSRESIGADEQDLEERDSLTGEKLPSLASRMMRDEMNECVRERLMLLPADYRTVLVLGDMEELSNAEIAEILGVSLETVKIRLHRARAKLRKDIEAFCKPAEWIPEE